MSESTELEGRRFPAPEQLAAQANVGPDAYERARRTGWASGRRRPTG
jgi:acetyl-CoA synthetase